MNKLTLNSVAFGSFKHRRREYKGVILGAGLAIFFVATMFLMLQSVYETQRLIHVERVGHQDAIIRDAEDIAPERLIQDGLVSAVGSLNVIAETDESKCPIGSFDEAGFEAAQPGVIEGRFPAAPGEIAVEMSFLQKLRTEAKVGDTLDLKLRIPSGRNADFLPDPVDVSFEVVGILAPRSVYLAGNVYSDYEYLKYPNALVMNDVPVETGGRAYVHRLVTYARGVTALRFEDYGVNTLDKWAVLTTDYSPFGSSPGDGGMSQFTMLLAIVFGCVLVAAACIGIVNAFAARLDARKRQIGMMRAVGATSRQIRRIFGREAMLFAALIAPISIAAAYAFVWGLCKLLGHVTMLSNPAFLPVIFIASVACVWLAASVPMMRVSKMPPMQAIRDVSLLRAKKRAKVRVKKVFDAPQLIGLRHLSLYKTKQAGIAIMIALSILMIAVLVPFVTGLWFTEWPYDYEIVSYRWPMWDLMEQRVTKHEGLTDADLAELRALPMVDKVDATSKVQVNMLVDKVTPYLMSELNNDYYNLDASDIDMDIVEMYQAFKRKQKIDKELVPTMLFACDDAIFESLGKYVNDGKIDMAAIDAGREVLVVAPNTFSKWEVQSPNGSYWQGSYDEAVKGRRDVIELERDDTLDVGTQLDLLRLYLHGDLPMIEDGPDFGATMLRETAQPVIGATLGGEVTNVINDMGIWSSGIGSMVTTHSGMAALGFETAGYQTTGLRLTGEPDDAVHAYISDAVAAIAARGTDMHVFNRVQEDRTSKIGSMVLRLAVVALMLILLSMCVGMINNAITNRVRSEKRSIGTLRAVGATMDDITKSYRVQALAMGGAGVVLGAVLCVAFFVAMYIFNIWNGSAGQMNTRLALLGSEVAFLGAIAVLCGINLSLRVREISRDSIVSNIREL